MKKPNQLDLELKVWLVADFTYPTTGYLPNSETKNAGYWRTLRDLLPDFGELFSVLYDWFLRISTKNSSYLLSFKKNLSSDFCFWIFLSKLKTFGGLRASRDRSIPCIRFSALLHRLPQNPDFTNELSLKLFTYVENWNFHPSPGTSNFEVRVLVISWRNLDFRAANGTEFWKVRWLSKSTTYKAFNSTSRSISSVGWIQLHLSSAKVEFYLRAKTRVVSKI